MQVAHTANWKHSTLLARALRHPLQVQQSPACSVALVTLSWKSSCYLMCVFEFQLSRASQAQSSSLLDLIGIPDRRLPERDFWMRRRLRKKQQDGSSKQAQRCIQQVSRICVCFSGGYPAIQSKPGTELFFARPYWDPRQKTTRKWLLNEDSVSRKLFCYTQCSLKMHACYTYMFGTQTEDYQKGTSEWEEGWGRNNKMVPPNRHRDVFSKSQGYVFVFQVETQLSRASQAQSSSLLDLIGFPDRRLPERNFWMKILSQGNCSATLIALSRCMHATPTCLGPRQQTTRKGLLNEKKV